jgi:ribosome maturation factor RimP
MRGRIVPSFYKNMTFKENLHIVLSDCLAEKPSIFLIDLMVTDAFKVIIALDSDHGVALQDCIDVSKFIDSKLDREEQDYSLEVASVGVGSALKQVRQYKKNIGRTLIVKTNSEIIEAELIDANDDFVILSWKAREPKKIGKGKETVQKELKISYVDIKEAIVTVTF